MLVYIMANDTKFWGRKPRMIFFSYRGERRRDIGLENDKS